MKSASLLMYTLALTSQMRCFTWCYMSCENWFFLPAWILWTFLQLSLSFLLQSCSCEKIKFRKCCAGKRGEEECKQAGTGGERRFRCSSWRWDGDVGGTSGLKETSWRSPTFSGSACVASLGTLTVCPEVFNRSLVRASGLRFCCSGGLTWPLCFFNRSSSQSQNFYLSQQPGWRS